MTKIARRGGGDPHLDPFELILWRINPGKANSLPYHCTSCFPVVKTEMLLRSHAQSTSRNESYAVRWIISPGEWENIILILNKISWQLIRCRMQDHIQSQQSVSQIRRWKGPEGGLLVTESLSAKLTQLNPNSPLSSAYFWIHFLFKVQPFPFLWGQGPTIFWNSATSPDSLYYLFYN